MRNTDFLFKTPIAHRGLWNAEYPENSLGAFQNAVKYGYPIEIDVRLSKDGQIVVFHDDTLNRMTNLSGPVSDYDFDTLTKTKLLNSEYTIPSFKQTLELIGGKVPLLIELKSAKNERRLSEFTIEQLKGYKGQYGVQSFNPYILRDFKRLAPAILRGQLATFDYGKISKIKAFFLRRMTFNKKTQPDFISYNKDNLPNKFVSACVGSCKGVLAWTVRSQQEYDAVKPYSDNIIFEGFMPKK